MMSFKVNFNIDGSRKISIISSLSDERPVYTLIIYVGTPWSLNVRVEGILLLLTTSWLLSGDWSLHMSGNGGISTVTDSSGSVWSRGRGWLIGCWRGQWGHRYHRVVWEVISELTIGWTHKLLILFIFTLIFKEIYTSDVYTSLPLELYYPFTIHPYPLSGFEAPKFLNMSIYLKRKMKVLSIVLYNHMLYVSEHKECKY